MGPMVPRIVSASLAFVVLLAACGSAAPATSGPAQPSSPVASAAMYTGSDRQQKLEDAARKEGSLMWYTTLAAPPLDSIPAAFEKKYPGITVQKYRGTPEEVMHRAVEETAAKQDIFDVVEAGDSALLPLSSQDLFQPFTSPLADKFPADSQWKAPGGGFTTVITRMSISGFGYNTEKLPASAVPATYQDLLKPELKGKMAWPGSDLPPRIVGNLLAHYGEAFVRQLGTQNMKVYAGSATVVQDLIGTGEVPGSPGAYRNQMGALKKKGAPADWVALDPVTPSPGGPALSKFAPHPNAAMLFIDFLLGPEVHDIMQNEGYASPSDKLPFGVWYPITGSTTPEEYAKNYDAWQKLVKELFGG